jgi:hypothetical protein
MNITFIVLLCATIFGAGIYLGGLIEAGNDSYRPTKIITLCIFLAVIIAALARQLP